MYKIIQKNFLLKSYKVFILFYSELLNINLTKRINLDF